MLGLNMPRSIVIFCILAASVCLAQAPPPAPQAQTPGVQLGQVLAQHPELLAEFGRFYQRLQREVTLPGPRSQSRLLPLLPGSTTVYAALPNYGEAASQALAVFHRELQRSPELRDWWTHGDMAKSGPQMEDALARFSQIAQYLGDEMVLSAAVDRNTPSAVLVAEIKKPGLKAALDALLRSLPAKSNPGVRVLDPQQLAALPDKPAGEDMLVLVRDDYVVAASGAATLRASNSSLDSHSGGFATTPFAQRLLQAYQDNVTIVAAADVGSIIQQAASQQKQDAAVLDRTGFADTRYVVWEHTRASGQDLSQSELSFNGTRHGIAAWLGAPTQLGSLDFASPKAISAISLVLANPSQMYDDLREIATAANPNGFAAVDQMQQGLKIDIQKDLLSLLAGELTLELDSVTPAPQWKAILRVTDPVHLQQTITTLLAGMDMRTETVTEGGVTYRQVSPPARAGAPASSQIAYTFVDHYLVIAASPEAAREAVRLHRSGESLGKSPRFLASLPPGHASGESALWYQGSAAMASLQMSAIPSGAEQLWAQQPPLVMAAYAEPTVIRGASTSSAMDAGVIGIVAAIAIPNLLRARVAANDASAVGAMRSITGAQKTYAATYADRGFAPDLASLGFAPGGPSADHAGLIAGSLSCSSADKWCEQSGFRFRIYPVCLQEQCPQYTLLAVPANTSSGGRNFCATSDGVIRFRMGPPPTAPVSVRECRSWPELR